VSVIFRFLSVLTLGCALVANAMGAPVIPSGESYIGYIGNLDLGRGDNSGPANPAIGTDWIADPDGQDINFIANTPIVAGNGTTGHWYKFALNTPSHLMDFVELGDNIDVVISFFHDNYVAGPAFDSVSRAGGTNHAFQLTSPHQFKSGIWWMQIVATTTSFASINYKVRLSQVPLPPAFLLFGSAIAGFGVMGRKRKQRQIS